MPITACPGRYWALLLALLLFPHGLLAQRSAEDYDPLEGQENARPRKSSREKHGTRSEKQKPEPKKEALFYLRQGRALLKNGQLAQARNYLARARDFYDKTEDDKALAAVDFYLGVLLTRQGGKDLDRGLELFKEALEIQQDLDLKPATAATYYQMGISQQAHQRPNDALAAYRKAAEIWGGVGHKEDQAAALNAQGLLLDQQRDPKAAEAAFSAARLLLSAPELEPFRATTIHNQAVSAYNRGDFDLAEKLFQEAMALQKKHNRKNDIAASLFHLGFIEQQRGHQPKTLELMKQAAGLWAEVRDRQNAARAFKQIALTFQAQGETDRAMVFFQRARQELEPGGSPIPLAAIYTHIGAVYAGRKDLDRAVTYYLKASQAYARAGRPVEAAQTNFYAGVLLERKDKTRALGYFKAALESQRKLGQSHDIAQTLSRMGTLMLRLNQDEPALDALDEALEIQQKEKDPEAVGNTLYAMGRVLARKREYEEALGCFKKARDIREQAKDRMGLSAVLFDLGQLHESKREYAPASDYYRKCLEIRKAAGTAASQAAALHAIGRTAHAQGDPVVAETSYQQALEIQHKLKLERAVAETQNDLGLLYHEKGQDEKALAAYQDALAQAKGTDPAGTATIYHNLGVTQLARGKTAEALAALNQALDLRRTPEAEVAAAQTMLAVAEVHRRDRHFEDAARTAQQAQAVFERKQDQLNLVRTLLLLASLKQQQGQADAAVFDFQRALSIQEQLGQNKDRAQTLETIGMLTADTNPHKAVDALARARDLYDRQGDNIAKARLTFEIAKALEKNGEAERAIGQYRQTQVVAQRIGNRTLEAEAMVREAALLTARGSGAEAAALIEKAHQLNPAGVDSRARIDGLLALGLALEQKGSFVDALARYGEALRVGTEPGKAPAPLNASELAKVVQIALRASAVSLRLGSSDAALDLAEQALDKAKNGGLVGLVPAIQLRRGLALLTLSRPESAADAFREALTSGNALSSAEQAMFYLALARAMLAAGNPVDALTAIDNGLLVLSPGMTLHEAAYAPDLGEIEEPQIASMLLYWRGRCCLKSATPSKMGEIAALSWAVISMQQSRAVRERVRGGDPTLAPCLVPSPSPAIVELEAITRLCAVDPRLKVDGDSLLTLVHKAKASLNPARRRVDDEE
jgi:tetratricopeptide (TPR) repeat protein